MITYNTNQYGLRQQDMDYMHRLFSGISSVEKVILFGSRTMGNFQPGSDVDLALIGTKITAREVAAIRDLLENEAPAILGYDVLHYDTLKHLQLKEQIDSYGKVIYTRS
ncbi:MAG: nucleotidyltransferase protein [Flavipsychrobacter sp.]|nr:nucleotidyltransferase protein [Flavipsychrobacter sp.]